MFLPLKLSVVMTILIIVYAQAGVLRGDDNSKDQVETTTLALETSTTLDKKVQATTPRDLLKNVPLAIALTRDEYASIKIVEESTTITSEDEVTTPKESVEEIPLTTALSRDEDASIKLLEVASVDPAPGTVEAAELVILEAPKVEKSAKLLLLSAPKNIEKPKEPEENIEEPEDIDDAGAERTTTQLMESTTIAEVNDDKEDNEETIDPSKLVTKLFAINDTLSADYPKKTSNTEQSEEWTKSENFKNSTEEESKDSAAGIPAEQISEPKNDNFGSTLLIETEADYVLVDADVEEFGSFTHENSAVHLQPIVQSVEIVPTYIDEPFIESYVHHW